MIREIFRLRDDIRKLVSNAIERTSAHMRTMIDILQARIVELKREIALVRDYTYLIYDRVVNYIRRLVDDLTNYMKTQLSLIYNMVLYIKEEFTTRINELYKFVLTKFDEIRSLVHGKVTELTEKISKISEDIKGVWVEIRGKIWRKLDEITDILFTPEKMIGLLSRYIEVLW